MIIHALPVVPAMRGDRVARSGRPQRAPLDWARLADYRRVFGPDRWSFKAGPWQVVGLNAQLFATGTWEQEQQFAWLEDQVRDGRGPFGMMLHKPLFRNGPADVEAHVRYVPASARRRLLALATRRDLRFVVSGHVHQWRRLEVDGVEHVWAPSSAPVAGRDLGRADIPGGGVAPPSRTLDARGRWSALQSRGKIPGMRVLLCTDGRSGSEAATTWLERFAPAEPSPLLIVAIAQSPPVSFGRSRALRPLNDLIIARSQRACETARARLEAGWPDSGVRLMEGDTHEQIDTQGGRGA